MKTIGVKLNSIAAAQKAALLILFILLAAFSAHASYADDADSVTREALVDSFVKAACLEEGIGGDTLSGFIDADNVGEKYKKSMETAVSMGLLKGSLTDEGAKLMASEKVSRLEALVLLSRFLPESSKSEVEASITNAPSWASEALNSLPEYVFDPNTGRNSSDLKGYISSSELLRYSEILASAWACLGTLSHEGYTLEKAVVLSRHNIRSPLSWSGSVLDRLTPYSWHEWSSNPGELSLRGGILETQMGQYFRKWLEDEGLFPENYIPEGDAVRIYSNSKQRTIATANYFSSGLLPAAGISVEHHGEFDSMDPVFLPGLGFCTDSYSEAVINEIESSFSKSIEELSDNYKLLSEVVDLENSEAYKNGEAEAFKQGDMEVTLEEGKEPAMTGSLKTACSLADALVLQYYEESDPLKASFNTPLTLEEWKDISDIKDVYVNVLYTAPSLSVNLAHPLLQEIRSELAEEERSFSFLCGHDSNVSSALSALKVEDYSLPGAIERNTSIGCKVVFSLWKAPDGEEYLSTDLVYQTSWQLHDMPLLSLENPPAIYHLSFSGLSQNEDGLYASSEFMESLDSAISEYDELKIRYR